LCVEEAEETQNQQRVSYWNVIALKRFAAKLAPGDVIAPTDNLFLMRCCDLGLTNPENTHSSADQTAGQILTRQHSLTNERESDKFYDTHGVY
jgi:hypothetical protein